MEKINLNGFEFTAGNWPFEENKPTILLIHGASLSKEFWKFQTNALKTFANTVSLDLPGHGGSTLPGRNTVTGYSEEVLALIKEMGRDTEIIVCGMSMGGAIAQQLLVDHPELFRAGILINTGARLKVLPMIFDMVRDNYQEYIDYLPRLSISSKSDPTKIAELSKDFTGKCSAITTLEDFEACNSFDLMDCIPEIKAPVLVMAAADDVSTPVKYGKWLHENIKGSQFVQIENAGHFSPLEQPEKVNAAIIDFLKSL